MLINLFSVFGRSQKWERNAKYLCFGALNDQQIIFLTLLGVKATIFANAEKSFTLLVIT